MQRRACLRSCLSSRRLFLLLLLLLRSCFVGTWRPHCECWYASNCCRPRHPSNRLVCNASRWLRSRIRAAVALGMPRCRPRTCRRRDRNSVPLLSHPRIHPRRCLFTARQPQAGAHTTITSSSSLTVHAVNPMPRAHALMGCAGRLTRRQHVRLLVSLLVSVFVRRTCVKVRAAALAGPVNRDTPRVGGREAYELTQARTPAARAPAALAAALAAQDARPLT